MASLYNVKGRVYLHVGKKRIPLGITITKSTKAEAFRKQVRIQFAGIVSRLSDKESADAGRLLNQSPQVLLKMASAARRRPAKAKGAVPKRAEAKPAKERPAKPITLTAKMLRRCMEGNKETIEALAKNKAALDAFLKKRPEAYARLLFARMLRMKIKKFDFTWVIAPLRPNVFADPEKPVSKLTAQEKIAAIRTFLYDFIATGNKPFQQELVQLYGTATPKLDDEKIAEPLDADTLIAASAYLRRHKEESTVGKGASAKLNPLELRAPVPKAKEVPVVKVTAKTAEEVYRIANDAKRRLNGFILKADPAAFVEYERGGKGIIATIPEGSPIAKKIKANALYLVAQAAFNKMKDEDPGFNEYLVQKKGEYSFLVDLKDKKVRMHDREVGTMAITRRGKTMNVPRDKIEQTVARALQEYLNIKINMSSRIKGDMNALYGKEGILGPKRVFRASGMPDRALFHELTVYFWRLNPANKYKASGAWVPKKGVKMEL